MARQSRTQSGDKLPQPHKTMDCTQLENASIDEINRIWDEWILLNERIYNGELCIIHAPITITPTRDQL
jgi:hypothetical protein